MKLPITQTGPETALKESVCPFVEFFPDEIRKGIIEINDSMGTNLDILCAGFLAAFSGAIGNRFVSKFDSYNVYANTFIVIVAPPGTGKSEPVKRALRVAGEHQSKKNEGYEAEVASFEAEGGKRPVRFWAKLGQFSIQALNQQLCLKRAPIIYRDELIGLFVGSNKSNAESLIVSFNSYWSAGDADQAAVTKESESVEDAIISLIGTIQNGVVEQIFGGFKKVTGFGSRCLPLIPADLKAPRVRKRADRKKAEYESCVDDALRYLYGISEDTYREEVDFDAEADDMAVEYYNDVLGSMYDELPEDSPKRPIFAKLRTYFVKFCLIHACIEASIQKRKTPYIIPADVEAAKGLTEFFIEQVDILLSVQGEQKQSSWTPTDWQRDVFNSLNALFTATEYREKAYELLGGKNDNNKSKISKALKKLKVEGLIEPESEGSERFVKTVELAA